MNTHLGRQWPNLIQKPESVLPVDETHQIKVYRHLNENLLLYVPQFKFKSVHGQTFWFGYLEKTDEYSSWDTWATWDLEEAERKCNAN